MVNPTPLAVIIGPPGSGKTTIARALADRLGVGVHDTDEAVERSHGASIADIFVTEGEATFRALEVAAVASALAEQAGIVSLGGGAPLDPSTRAALAEHVIFFLDVGIADAAHRIGFDRSRPLLAVNPRASWIAMMKARRPIYEGLATYRVDTAGRTPDEIVTEIAGLLTASSAPAAPGAPLTDESGSPAAPGAYR